MPTLMLGDKFSEAIVQLLVLLLPKEARKPITQLMEAFADKCAEVAASQPENQEEDALAEEKLR